MPGFLMLGDPQTTQDPPNPGKSGGDPTGHIGMKHETLQEFRPETFKTSDQPTDCLHWFAFGNSKAIDFQPMISENLSQWFLTAKINHAYLPAFFIQAGSEIHESFFSPTHIEIRDQKRNAHWLNRPLGLMG
jgi:hypothetical protein